MKKLSAGLLLYRRSKGGVEVLLVHPGGPFWAKKDKGAWSIPKGEPDENEDQLDAAKREFCEETGGDIPKGEYISLGEAKQSSGKIVKIWAVEADFDIKQFKSNNFELEWPPKSGKMQEFPECDQAKWFTLEVAQAKLVKGQRPFINNLAEYLGVAIEVPESSMPDQITLF